MAVAEATAFCVGVGKVRAEPPNRKDYPMRIRYGGTYSGDPADLPQREHMPGAVRFREPEDPAALGRQIMAERNVNYRK